MVGLTTNCVTAVASRSGKPGDVFKTLKYMYIYIYNVRSLLQALTEGDFLWKRGVLGGVNREY